MEMAVNAAEKEGLNGVVSGQEHDEEEDESKGRENGAVHAGEVMMVKEMEEESREDNTSL